MIVLYVAVMAGTAALLVWCLLRELWMGAAMTAMVLAGALIPIVGK